MTSRHRHHSAWKAAKVTGRAASQAAKYAENTALGLARWATTDHTGTAKILANMPPMGFIDTIGMVLMTVVSSLLGAVASAAMVFLLIAYGIPALLFM